MLSLTREHDPPGQILQAGQAWVGFIVFRCAPVCPGDMCPRDTCPGKWMMVIILTILGGHHPRMVRMVTIIHYHKAPLNQRSKTVRGPTKRFGAADKWMMVTNLWWNLWTPVTMKQFLKVPSKLPTLAVLSTLFFVDTNCHKVAVFWPRRQTARPRQFW